MKKRKFRLAEPANLTLEQLSADDPTLPKPNGSRLFQSFSRPNKYEIARLQRTHDFGGLGPDKNGLQYWMCASCQSVHRSKKAAFVCHGQGACQVQVCQGCGQRITSCTCLPIQQRIKALSPAERKAVERVKQTFNAQIVV
jgi:hypothetical protein